MGGIPGSPVTRMPVQTVTIEREGSAEILHRFVRADGTRCVATERPLGVGQVSSTTDGDLVPIIRAGIATVEAGGAIALGAGESAVQTDLEGRAVTRTGNNPIAGYVIDAASASGDLVRVILL